MSQTSTHPALKWILIVIAVVTVLCVAFIVLYGTYPADEYRVARELHSRGFIIGYDWRDDNKIWRRPIRVTGDSQVITSDDCRLFFQLPRLLFLNLVSCDMVDLNLDEIGNCRDLQFFYCNDVTRFPVSELKKLAACSIWHIYVDSNDVDFNDSDLEEFVKFTHLKNLDLRFNNTGVTDTCLEYFEKIPTLKYLKLPGASITPEGVEEFQKKRPDVEIHLE